MFPVLWIELSSQQDKMEASWSIIKNWPRENQAVFERIIFHIVQVAQFVGRNKMDKNALAVVFAPSLFVSPPHHDISRDIKQIKPVVE